MIETMEQFARYLLEPHRRAECSWSSRNLPVQCPHLQQLIEGVLLVGVTKEQIQNCSCFCGVWQTGNPLNLMERTYQSGDTFCKRLYEVLRMVVGLVECSVGSPPLIIEDGQIHLVLPAATPQDLQNAILDVEKQFSGSEILRAWSAVVPSIKGRRPGRRTFKELLRHARGVLLQIEKRVGVEEEEFHGPIARECIVSPHGYLEVGGPL